MISVVIVFLNNSVWKNYMKKDKFFIVGCKKTNEGGLLL